MNFHDFDPIDILKSVGYVGMFISVVLENGVIFLFFLPSDSLLFAAGLLVSLGYFDLWITLGVCFLASIIGYMLGYSIGYKAGPKVFRENNKKMMTQKHLEHAKEFYNKYASFALIFARFFPIRAFISTMAGASHVDYPTFMLYNVIGGAIWSIGIILIGFFFGQLITPDDLNIVFAGLLVCCLSIFLTMPLALGYLKRRSAHKDNKDQS